MCFTSRFSKKSSISNSFQCKLPTSNTQGIHVCRHKTIRTICFNTFSSILLLRSAGTNFVKRNLRHIGNLVCCFAITIWNICRRIKPLLLKIFLINELLRLVVLSIGKLYSIFYLKIRARCAKHIVWLSKGLSCAWNYNS